MEKEISFVVYDLEQFSILNSDELYEGIQKKNIDANIGPDPETIQGDDDVDDWTC
jgi:hypothetical protein